MGLAQALIHNPEVLILDEPTAGLDPKQIIETRRLIKELGGDHTIILSTHILPEVAQTCQRVVIINKGKVVAVDTPDNLTHRLRGAATMFVQMDGARAAEARDGAASGRRASRASTPAEAGGDGAFEVDSETGSRRAARARRAVVARRLGPAGAAADAHEPRGHLPVAHHRGDSQRGGGP